MVVSIAGVWKEAAMTSRPCGHCPHEAIFHFDSNLPKRSHSEHITNNELNLAYTLCERWKTWSSQNGENSYGARRWKEWESFYLGTDRFATTRRSIASQLTYTVFNSSDYSKNENIPLLCEGNKIETKHAASKKKRLSFFSFEQAQKATMSIRSIRFNK